jgi:hypothetical protein
MEMHGMPARFGDKVKISLRYIVRGSSIFSPILKAGVGATGVNVSEILQLTENTGI